MSKCQLYISILDLHDTQIWRYNSRKQVLRSYYFSQTKLLKIRSLA
nr:MAG TPA: hypothetical protein [Caudoviricetes sp.]